MLMVAPDTFFQSNPPLTSAAPLGALVLPPTPHALRTGMLATAAPAKPMAANMFRRDIGRPVKSRAIGATSLCRDQGDFDRLLSAGHQVEALLEFGQRQLVCAYVIHRQHAVFDHLDRSGPAVRPEVSAQHVEFFVVADDAPVDCHVAAEDAVLHVSTEFA